MANLLQLFRIFKFCRLMQKILVTGATGFIGNYVVDELLRNNREVIATSSDLHKAQNMHWYPAVKYVAFNLDAFDPAIDYADYFGQPDKMIHLAWQGLPNYKAA